ncbi:MAG: class I SAM-dependent methyltransferase [Burkholderiales bacterium]
MVDWPLFEQFFQRCPEAAELARRANRDRLTNQADADLKRFRGYFNELSALVPSGKHRYLDVGASVGHSLTAAVDAGYEAHGIEADPDARHLARITHQGIVDDFARLPAIDYALISLWETLEHIASPLDVLQACAERLLPDGILVVTVPNLDATSTRLLREECSYVHGGFNQPGHINLFSRSSLESLFKRAGLRLLASDGLYSNDAITLLARLVRTSRGIGANDELNIDSALLAVLNAVGPAINIIEGLSGKQPILRCIAAREPVPESLRTRVDDWSQSRRAALAEEARGHLAGITDHLVHIKLLEQAVIERDRMLAEQTIAYSAEIEKRDKMLEKSNRMWPWLR